MRRPEGGEPQQVVVKKPLPGACTDKDAEDLRKEMQFASDHPHPHVVELVGYCEQPMALVCEFMSGGDLQKVLDSPLRLAELSLLHRVQILAHAAAGLSHLHANGVLHKDVKPSNIMLRWQSKESGGLQHVPSGPVHRRRSVR